MLLFLFAFIPIGIILSLLPFPKTLINSSLRYKPKIPLTDLSSLLIDFCISNSFLNVETWFCSIKFRIGSVPCCIFINDFCNYIISTNNDCFIPATESGRRFYALELSNDLAGIVNNETLFARSIENINKNIFSGVLTTNRIFNHGGEYPIANINNPLTNKDGVTSGTVDIMTGIYEYKYYQIVVRGIGEK